MRISDWSSDVCSSDLRLRDAARTRLRNWEISDAQLGQTGLVLTAPADAVVIEKPVVQGARFEPGETILRLADLSTVWVIAKVPAAQASGIMAGQPARFETVRSEERRVGKECVSTCRSRG